MNAEKKAQKLFRTNLKNSSCWKIEQAAQKSAQKLWKYNIKLENPGEYKIVIKKYGKYSSESIFMLQKTIQYPQWQNINIW